MKKYIVWCWIMTLCAFAWSQQIDILDTAPGSTKWFTIKTPNFRLVFPDSYYDEGERMASLLEHIHEPTYRTMGSHPKRISIIFQNQHSVPNGFVTLGPRRSELYTTPPQNYNFVGNNQWMSLLAVHEYRHVAQYQHSRRGFNKVFSVLFGEYTQAAMANAAAPLWFWEGDAVAIETALTPSGRGRIPDFDRVFRANLLEGRRFNYHKQYLRSYKDFIPNHYVLGYHMVTHVRRQHDAEVWGRITARSWAVPFAPFAFSWALQAKTGSGVVRTYNQMADELTNLWTEQLSGLELTKFEVLNPRKGKAFTEYHYPQPLPDGSVLALKNGIGEIDQFVKLEGGKEKKIRLPGILNNNGMLSVGGNKLVWNEYGFDPRWRKRTYSNIKVMDLDTRKIQKITSKGRYSGAAISPDGRRIIAVFTSVSGVIQLALLHAETGDVLKHFPNSDNEQLSMPRWSTDGQRVVFLSVGEKGKSVCGLDPSREEWYKLYDFADENVGHPTFHGDYLLYNSPYSGIDNIYAIHLPTGDRFQVTTSKYGAYNPAVSPDGKYLYYNDFHVKGMEAVRAPFAPERWTSLSEADVKKVDYFQPLVEQEGHHDLLEEIPPLTYDVKSYRAGLRVLRPHSWGPFTSFDFAQAELGLFSQDVLSTFYSYYGYTYNAEEGTGLLSTRMSYQGLYPVLDLSAGYGQRYGAYLSQGEQVDVNWLEKDVSFGSRLPLLLTNSRFHSQVTLGYHLGMRHISNYTGDPVYSLLRDGKLFHNNASFVGFRLLKQSYRDIFSKWGQVLWADFTHTPLKSDFEGRQLALRGIAYFPGLLKHHSFYVIGAFQQNRITLDNDNYWFINKIPKPRGYVYSTAAKYSTAMFNYTFPIMYPDIALGPILNIQRLRTNLFFDYGIGQYTGSVNNQVVTTTRDNLSLGVEGKIDFNFMRLLPQFEIGARLSYIPEFQSTYFEILLGNFGF
jgi:hypothetical protein